MSVIKHDPIGGPPSKGFRLDRTDAKIWGVCGGIANYTGIDAVWIRIGLVAATLLLTGLTIPVYIATALIAD